MSNKENTFLGNLHAAELQAKLEVALLQYDMDMSAMKRRYDELVERHQRDNALAKERLVNTQCESTHVSEAAIQTDEIHNKHEMENSALRSQLEESERKLRGQVNERKMQVKMTESKFQNELDKNRALIESLLIDKEQRITECTQLNEKLKRKMIRNEELFRQEIERESQKMALRDKHVRCKWEAKREAEIRQQTVKGLEPEIEKIISNHRDEKKILHAKLAEQEEVFRLNCQTQVSQAIDAERKLFMERERSTFKRFADQLDEALHAHRDDLERVKASHLTDLGEVQSQLKKEFASNASAKQEEFVREMEAKKLEWETEKAVFKESLKKEKEDEIEEIIDKLSKANFSRIRLKLDQTIDELRSDIEHLREESEMKQKVIESNIGLEEQQRFLETKNNELMRLLRNVSNTTC